MKRFASDSIVLAVLVGIGMMSYKPQQESVDASPSPPDTSVVDAAAQPDQSAALEQLRSDMQLQLDQVRNDLIAVTDKLKTAEEKLASQQVAAEAPVEPNFTEPQPEPAAKAVPVAKQEAQWQLQTYRYGWRGRNVGQRWVQCSAGNCAR